ncbi:unnamed protein product [Caenorhabditis angaria]|uniref:Uncharacterized protein n=1 Tax=Caenorhabditis angaria TaxID=860376 RepID=A0A9P1IXC7_9PELO|nr:unnamed protein product [Caenorhabditis angaria]
MVLKYFLFFVSTSFALGPPGISIDDTPITVTSARTAPPQVIFTPATTLRPPPVRRVVAVATTQRPVAQPQQKWPQSQSQDPWSDNRPPPPPWWDRPPPPWGWPHPPPPPHHRPPWGWPPPPHHRGWPHPPPPPPPEWDNNQWG